VASALVLEHAVPGSVALSEPLRREGYNVLSVPSQAEAIDLMHELRADLLVIDARHAAANYAPLFRELCNQPAYAGLPILIVGAGVAEYHCVGGSPGSEDKMVIKADDDPLPKALLDRVRHRLQRLAGPLH
jgi:DNA-binding response OmpR family regulator